MATTDSQLALARPPRIQSHVPKAARQIVPAFLQKLYQMVSDDKNRDLITWSDAGDSFFVLDHERFAREVLGHWFKHQRFSSFVRQLNMYGFHKIPHLQQGVLRSDSDTEYWNFTHPNFRRDQPDLLCLIQRKKQSAALAQDGTVDIRDPNTPTTTTTTTTSNAPVMANPPASSSPTISLTQGQLLDMHSILQGIAAIKRHQTTISSELTELKQSNQMLYSESRIARSKLQNQQELIDRILKFLAGVFGSTHSASSSSGGGSGHRGRRNASSDELDALMRGSDANKAVIPTRRRSAGGRLMIEAAKVGEGSGKPGIVELEDLREGPLGDDDEEEDVTMSENSFNSNYDVETPFSIPSPSPSENTPGTIGETKDRPDLSGITANPTLTTPNPPNVHAQPSAPSPSDSNTTAPQTNTHLELERALTPTNNHHNHNDTFEINQPWANMFGGRSGITNDQLSHLLAVLAQTGPGGNVTSGGFDESLAGFDHHTGYSGQDVGDVGLGFGGQGVVQPGQIQGGEAQPSSSSSSAGGGNQLAYPPPFSPGGFDFASFLQNLSPPSSAGLPPLPSAPTPSFQQQQQQQGQQQQQVPGLSSYGLLEDSLGHPSPTEGGGGLITLDSTAFHHDTVPLSPRLGRHFQSTQEVEKEVSDMDKQMNQWIEQLGPILGSAVDVGDGHVDSTGMGNCGSGSMGSTVGAGVDVPIDVGAGAVIPPSSSSNESTMNGLEDLDFDSFLNISAPVSHGVDEEEDEDFGDEDEEDEDEEGDEGIGGKASVGDGSDSLKKGDVVGKSSSMTTMTMTTGGGGERKRKSDVMMEVVVDDDNGGGEGLGKGGKVKRRRD